MLQRHLMAAGATLAVIIAGTATSPVSAAAPDPASRAVAYLQANLRTDGSLDGSAGETEDLVLGASAAGTPGAALHAPGSTITALQWLQGQTASGATLASAGSTAKLLLAVVAARGNPRSFGGHDLVTTLGGFYTAGTGRFGDGSTFGQSLSILGLRAAAQPVPAAAVTWLQHLQDSDGSWNFTSTPNTTEGDTNSTSIAVQALAAAGARGTIPAAVAYLHTQQNPDGGFPFQKPSPFGTASDPDSDATVLQGLVAAGQHPLAVAWQQGGHTALSNLLTMQTTTGGVTFPGNAGPDTFTTSQVPAGMELARLPIHPGGS